MMLFDRYVVVILLQAAAGESFLKQRICGGEWRGRFAENPSAKNVATPPGTSWLH